MNGYSFVSVTLSFHHFMCTFALCVCLCVWARWSIPLCASYECVYTVCVCLIGGTSWTWPLCFYQWWASPWRRLRSVLRCPSTPPSSGSWEFWGLHEVHHQPHWTHTHTSTDTCITTLPFGEIKYQNMTCIAANVLSLCVYIHALYRCVYVWVCDTQGVN